MPCFFPSVDQKRGRYYHLTCSIFYFLPEVGFNDLDDGGDYDNAMSIIISDVFEFKREKRKRSASVGSLRVSRDKWLNHSTLKAH